MQRPTTSRIYSRKAHWLAILFFSLYSPWLWAQHPILDDFTVFQYNEDIYLSWTISRGSTCNGITIERSENGLDFDVIHYISGVCGSADFAQNYSFIDQNPLPNTENHYRLELGLQGYSETVSLRFISPGEEGFMLYPNPASDLINVRFSNQSGHNHLLEIVSLVGNVIYSETTRNNVFQKEISQYPQGVYLMRLTNEVNGNSFTRKLVITH